MHSCTTIDTQSCNFSLSNYHLFPLFQVGETHNIRIVKLCVSIVICFHGMDDASGKKS